MSRLINQQRAHALERLRERYAPEAGPDAVLEIEVLARGAVASGLGSIEPGSDAVVVGVEWRDHEIVAVFVPRFDCLRTVLPKFDHQPSRALADAFRRAWGIAS